MPLTFPNRRAPLLLAACLALMVGACGRKGPLEPPVDPSATAPATVPAPSATTKRRGVPADSRLRPGAARAAQMTPAALATDPLSRVEDNPDYDDNDDEVTDAVTPIPTVRKRSRAFVVPTESFVLDPLL